ncbi:MAG: cation:proton antiporter, partial [Mycobacterium sp.]|nr:cation:proton antiporter [Mycobacterium sp.]
RAVPLPGLALFMGVAMSITAFPVLARMLLERRMNRTLVGVLALSAAAVDDILAWTLLALVTAVVKGGSAFSVARTIALSLVFAAASVVVLKPLLTRMVSRHKRTGRITPDMLAVILVGLLLSAFITERIGIHEIFGAFLFGAIMPHKGAQALRRDIIERLEQLSVLLLLPIFFVTVGFGVNLRLFKDLGLLWQLLLILAVAVGGKFCGAFAGARIQRMSFQHSAAIAVSMNTRGLTELVILTVGQQVGVLDDSMFTMMVVMALITTVMTEPLLRRIYPDDAVRRDVDAAVEAAPATGQSYPVLVVVDDDPSALTMRMIQVAQDALAGRQAGGILLVRYLDGANDAAPLELGANAVFDIARMTDAAEALERFAARTAAPATPLRVWCRFGSPSGRDLERHIAAAGAEVVVLGEDWMRSHPAAYDTLDTVTIKAVR